MIPRTRVELRERRHLRLRQKLRGTAERPRMSVCFTDKHIYVQFIDDLGGRTLASMSTVAPEAKGTKSNLAGAKKIGSLAAQKAKENLEAASLRILGSVLNNRTFPIPETIYWKL